MSDNPQRKYPPKPPMTKPELDKCLRVLRLSKSDAQKLFDHDLRLPIPPMVARCIRYCAMNDPFYTKLKTLRQHFPHLKMESLRPISKS